MDSNHPVISSIILFQQGIKQGYEVLAFDAPAHGQSEGKTSNLLDYMEMIRKIN